VKARAAAARIVAAVTDGQSLNTALAPGLASVAQEQQALTRELVYGTLRQWPRLKALTNQSLRKPMKPRDSDITALICLGLYQLSALRVPEHAAVSETVNTTRDLDKGWASSLVNGVLRNYLRNREDMEARLSPAAREASPEWLWQALRRQWPDQAGDILAAARERPPMTLRINLDRTTREAYLETLAGAGLEATAGDAAPSAATLGSPVDVHQLPGFAEGLVSVQDESAQLAAALLAPKDGEQILDACAAPGGKTCHLLELAPNAHVLATDSSKERLERIRENAERLNLKPDIECMDAARAAETLEGRHFDGILADVPCSASGVIRRNPDIKVHRKAADIPRFVEQQKAILQGLWPLLRPGGRLLYVTCSVLREENDAVVEHALDSLPGAARASLNVPGAVETATGYQRLPQPGGSDGLFFALLEREYD